MRHIALHGNGVELAPPPSVHHADLDQFRSHCDSWKRSIELLFVHRGTLCSICWPAGTGRATSSLIQCVGLRSRVWSTRATPCSYSQCWVFPARLRRGCDGLPINGGTYNALLNTTSKRMASIAVSQSPQLRCNCSC